MKRAISLLLPLLLLIGAAASAETLAPGSQKETADKLIGAGMSDMAGQGQDTEPLKPGERKGRYVIHFKNGGTLETDNYTVEKDSVKVVLSAGSIFLDKAMIRSIEEVSGPDDETIQSTPVEAPARPAPPARPGQGGGSGPAVTQPERPAEITDNNGHDEYWWKLRVEDWKKKKQDAELRYEKAKADWNNYEGTLNSLVSGGDASQYDVIRYQDMRGAARVDMDKAKSEMDDADRMLNEVLPDEARKAGAPPGWAR